MSVSSNDRAISIPFHADTLLLLVLGSAHMWFNKAISAILVGLIAIYIALDIWRMPAARQSALPNAKGIWWLRRIIVLFVLIAVAVLPAGWEIIQRQSEGKHTHATDSLIQTEIALEYFLEGQNPYQMDYVDTPLEEWSGGEPPFRAIRGPLYHFAYLPMTFLSAVPFHQVAEWVLGWYDQRFLYLLMYFGVILLLPELVSDNRRQIILSLLVGLNFLFIFHLAEGRNDVGILFWLILTSVLLARQQTVAAGVTFGLALVTKHQAWFFLPFFLAYTAPRPLTRDDARRWLVSLWPLYLTVFVFLMPFVLWDPTAFFEDTVLYILGGTEYSFPIRGIGLSYLLVTMGLLPSYQASFPFVVLSTIIGLPVLGWGLYRQWRDNSLRNMWLAFALFALSWQYFSRFFNDNYFVFVVLALTVGAFVDVDQKVTGEHMVEHNAHAQ